MKNKAGSKIKFMLWNCILGFKAEIDISNKMNHKQINDRPKRPKKGNKTKMLWIQLVITQNTKNTNKYVKWYV